MGQVGLGWVGLGPVRFGAVRSMGYGRGGEGNGTQRTEALRDQGERAEVGPGRGEDVLKVENSVWFGLVWFASRECHPIRPITDSDHLEP